MERFNSLKDFYPYYLTEHLNTTCRALHIIGTTLIILIFIVAIVKSRFWLFALIPVVGYGFAWVGHFVFEKNKPATFKYPLYSLASDFIMWWHTITFQIDDKITEAKRMYH